jgi:hypothetical protein
MAIILTNSSNQDWNNLINKPSILNDGLISWDEVQNKPVIESGTFTPVLVDSSGFNYSHSLQSGKYWRGEQICHFNLKLTVNMASSGNGALQLAGLPFSFSNEQFLNGYFHGIASNFSPLFFGVSGQGKINILYTTGTSSLFTSTLKGSNFRSSGNFNVYCEGVILLA